MKIALFTESFLSGDAPAADGTSLTVSAYAKYLTEHGHGVFIASPRSVKKGDGFPVLGRTAEGEYPLVSPYSRKLARQVRAFDPDVLHAHTPFLAATAALKLGKSLSVPVALTLHSKYDMDIGRFAKSAFTRGRVHKLMLDNIRAADEVWLPSLAAADDLRRMGYSGGHILVPHGTDFPVSDSDSEERSEDVEVRTRFNIPHNVPVLLTVTRLLRHKNLEMLLDALDALRDRGQSFHALIVGGGPDRAELEDYATSRRLDGLTHFVGAMPDRAKLRALYDCCDLFVIPSRHENGAHTLLAAAARGVAALTTEGSAASELIEPEVSGFVCANSADGIAEGIADALSDRRRLRKVSANARSRIYLSWDNAGTAIVRRYEALRRIHSSRLSEMAYAKKNGRRLNVSPAKLRETKETID
ncbi:glycosyl transferase [Clostridia bacterium]|nr:glycosyl transferase [Clostridia bacterium]